MDRQVAKAGWRGGDRDEPLTERPGGEQQKATREPAPSWLRQSIESVVVPGYQCGGRPHHGRRSLVTPAVASPSPGLHPPGRARIRRRGNGRVCSHARRGGRRTGAAQPLEIGLGPQLFLDDHLIDRLEGLERRAEPPERLETPRPGQQDVRLHAALRDGDPRPGEAVDSGSGTTTARPSGTRSPTTACTGRTRGSPGTCPEATGRASSTTVSGRGTRIAVTSSPTGRRPAPARTARATTAGCTSASRPTDSAGPPTTGTRSCRPGPRATASRRGTAWATSSTSTTTR